MKLLQEVFGEIAARLFPTGSDLTDNVVKSGIWSGLTNVLSRLLQFSRVLILATFLPPRAFGILGIALLTLSVLRRFTELGINDALIHNENPNVDEYLNTVWTVKLLRGLFLFSSLVLLAPIISSFFQEPVTEIIRVMAVVPLLQGLENPAIVYFQKNLQFHKRFLYEVGSSFVDALCAIILAFVWGNLWALIIGVLAGRCARVAISHTITDFWPSLSFDLNRITELVSYGKWITSLNILVFLANEGDDIFVGWMLDATMLGLYQVGYRISNLPATEISNVISRVVFPAYAQIQDDTTQLREGFFQTYKLVSVVAFPVTIGIIVTVEPFINGYLEENWSKAITTIQILAFWGLLRALGSTSGPLFKAIGRPDFLTKISLGKVILIAIFIWPATKQYGIEGTALVIVGNAILFSEPVVYYLALKVLESSFSRLLWVLSAPVVASSCMGLGIFILRTHTAFSPAFEFPLLVISGIIIYTIALFLFDWKFTYGLQPLIQRISSPFR